MFTAVAMMGQSWIGIPSRLLNNIRRSSARHPFIWGGELMIVTTALWALAFAAPLAIPSASSIEIAMGRFIVYGLISVGLFGFGRFAALPGPLIRRAVAYALAGNVVYYVLLVAGIQLGDATMAVLIIGMLPVTVALAGRTGKPRNPLGTVIGPLSVFGAGLFLFNAAKTDFFRDLGALSPVAIVCVTASLVMWTWYAVSNARFLRSTNTISETDWSSVVGIASLGIALLGLPLGWAFGLARNPLSLDLAELFDVAVWSVILGGGSTWFGTVLFNRASKLLETSILGQLIVFEAVFGVLYVFVFSGSAPSAWSLAGICIALMGVWWSVRSVERS